MILGVELSSHPNEQDRLGSVFRQFARGAGISAIGRLIGRGVGYLGQVLLARILLPDSYGLFALGWTMLRLVSIVSPLGLDNGVIRFGTLHWQQDNSRFRGVFILSILGSLLFSTLIGTAVYIYSPWLSTSFFHKPDLEIIFKGFAFMIPSAALLRVLVAASSVSQKMLCGSMAEDVIQPVAQVAIFLLIIRWFNPLSSAIVATALSFFLSLIIGVGCALWQIPQAVRLTKLSYIDLFPLFRFSLGSVAAITFGVLNIWGDRLIVGYFRPENEVGIYQSASLLAVLLVVVLSGIKTIMAPVAAKLYQNGQNAQLGELIRIVNKWVLYLSLPYILFIISAPREILLVVLGSHYQSGSTTLVVLTFAQLLYVVFGLADQIFLMTGHHKDWLFISSGTFLISFVLNILFVPEFGLLGAAFISLISSFIALIASITRVVQLLNIWPFDRRHIKPVISALLTGSLLYFVMQTFQLLPTHKLLLGASISFFVYAITIFALGIDIEERELFPVLFSKRKSD